MKNKVIYITSGLWPLNNGAKLYSHGLCKEFSKYSEMEIFTLASNEDNYENIDINNVQIHIYRYGKFKQSFCFNPVKWVHSRICGFFAVNIELIDDVIKSISVNKPNIIFIDQISMYEYYSVLKRICKKNRIKLIYISHNAELANFKESAYVNPKDFKDKIKKEIKYLFLKKAEEQIIQNTDFVFSICQDDINYFNDHNYKYNNMVRCKPLIDFKCIKKDVAQFQYNIVFVGSMFWYPNIRGIIWFCDNVFPKLLQIDNRYKLYVVGRDPASSLYKYKEIFKENFILTGFVDSIEPYYEMADIVIIPLFEGMGAKIKVLESIASGVPTIMTKFSASSYDVDNEMLIANNTQEFIENIKKLSFSYEIRKKSHDNQLNFYKNYMCADKTIVNIVSE